MDRLLATIPDARLRRYLFHRLIDQAYLCTLNPRIACHGELIHKTWAIQTILAYGIWDQQESRIRRHRNPIGTWGSNGWDDYHFWYIDRAPGVIVGLDYSLPWY